MVARRKIASQVSRSTKRRLTQAGNETRSLRVGDIVTLTIGKRTVKVSVIEDRGNIGFRGRQIVRLQTNEDSSDDLVSFELPASELKLVTS